MTARAAIAEAAPTLTRSTAHAETLGQNGDGDVKEEEEEEDKEIELLHVEVMGALLLGVRGAAVEVRVRGTSCMAAAQQHPQADRRWPRVATRAQAARRNGRPRMGLAGADGCSSSC
jgi:hypothetical protein